MIFLTALPWRILMWHPHLRSNVQWRSANQKIFRLCLVEAIDDNIHLINLHGQILLHVEEQFYKCLKYWQVIMTRVQTNFLSKISVIFSLSSFFVCDPY